MQYTKKPITIEAVQWDGNEISEVTPWIKEALEKAISQPGSVGSIMRVSNKVEIITLEGAMLAQPGDYIIKGIKGELYPCKPDIFEASYNKGSESFYMPKLDQIIQNFGYQKGEVSPVALLGLFGEAGEVLNEANVMVADGSTKDQFEVDHETWQATSIAKTIDSYKKEIRKGHDTVFIHLEDATKFDKELADCFYYLKILALNRGMSLDDLAMLSIAKIESHKEKATG